MGQQAFFNQFMKVILRSPLQGLFGRSFMLITVKGRKSGKAYTTPVNYLRQGDTLTIASLRNRTWWRNLRGGSPLTLTLQGRDVQGRGTVVEDDPGVAASLTDYLHQAPNLAKYFGVALDADGKPRSVDIARAAQTRVMVQVKLA